MCNRSLGIKVSMGRRRQAGVALVLSIVLLLIMTIIGIALVAGAMMQERMSGSQRLQVLAFQAASAGIAEALDWGFEVDVDGNYVNWNGSECGRVAGVGWESEWTAARPIGNGEYRLKIRCREDEAFLDVDGFTDAGESAPPQLFVLSEGAFRVDGQIASRRQIEVRIENRAGSDGNVDPAIRVEGDSISFSPASGNRFVVNGAGGAAISTTDIADAAMIEGEIINTGPSDGVGRLGNYPGGIEDGAGQYPFDSPQNLYDFVRKIKAALEGGSTCGNFVERNLEGAGVGGGGGGSPTCDDTDALNVTNLDYSFSGNNLTYVTGDAIIGPNLEGSGLLIVEGKVCLNGRADFRGQIISLDGLFEMYGGGNGRTEGAIFVADVDVKAEVVPTGWGETTLDVSGGGTHQLTYACDRVEQARNLALACDSTLDQWQPLCDGEGGRALGIGSRLRMVGWRESLGWREDFFEDPEM